MKCEECGSSLVFVDAEKDITWCKSCGYTEGTDYRTFMGVVRHGRT